MPNFMRGDVVGSCVPSQARTLAAATCDWQRAAKTQSSAHMADVPFWVQWRRNLRRFPTLYRRLLHVRATLRHGALRFFRLSIPAAWDFGPPKGWFSLADKLRRGEVEGRIILERQPEPKTPAQSLRVLARLGQDQQSHWPIFWTRQHDAQLIGRTLLFQDARRRVAVESGFGPGSIQDDAGYQQFRRPPPLRLEGPWTSVVSRWSETFCHWFLDTLSRLALLQEFPADTRIIVPANLASYQRETIALLGLEQRVRPTSEQHLRIENYYFASPTNMTGLFDPFGATFLRETLRPKADRSFLGPRRFFLHRRGAARGIVNETEVLDVFRERGWEVVDTQGMHMAHQIQLFARAEHICALHGAGLTNLLWCEPGCRVLELVASTYMNGVYEGLSEALGLNYQFMLCPGDAEFKAHVDIGELRRRLPR
jgi:capsular polysaccharide biosynthesis protein